MVKTNGAEFRRYYADPAFWPDGAYHDDAIVCVNGVEEVDFDADAIPDAAVVSIEGGGVFGFAANDGDPPSMEAHFKRWRKTQTTAVFTVECPKDKFDAVKAAIKAAGGKV
jgi:hypothetical protein